MQRIGDISDVAMKVDPYLLKIYKEQLPPRVHMEKAIQVQRLSQIPKAGRGLFAREDIKEGELIFAVDPIIITVRPRPTIQTMGIVDQLEFKLFR